ncbi:acyl-protein synthetase [Candidatus Omnitrophota bacterium]
MNKISQKSVECLVTSNPYCLKRRDKKRLLLEQLRKLTLKHRRNCQAYKRILEALPFSLSSVDSLEDIPMLPVGLFKTCELRSVPGKLIKKTILSSGTTSQISSRVFLDQETLALGAQAWRATVFSFIGKKKYPIISVDASGKIQDEVTSRVRGSSLRGAMNISSDHLFLLDDSMNPQWNKLKSFLKKHGQERIILFGFTFIIWQHLYRPLMKKRCRLDLGESILIHAGGWKKMDELAVNNRVFKSRLKYQLGIKKIYNLYSMAELFGVIFLECERGHLHVPDFADIIIRDQTSLKPLAPGRRGLIQVLNTIARSYPGHSLLTEDLGTVLGEDDCRCGRKGKHFRVEGRMPLAELRGCSDIYAAEYTRPGEV